MLGTTRHRRDTAVQPRRGLGGIRVSTAIPARLRQRLGWNLTVSYAVVTVVVLATMQLILLLAGSVFVVVALNRNGETIARDLRDRAAPAVAPLLETSAADFTGVDRWLRGVETNGVVPEGDARVQIRPDASVLVKKTSRLLIVDRAGQLAGSIKQTAVPLAPAPLPESDVPGLTGAVAAALAGRESWTTLPQWPSPKRLTVAVPVRDGQGAVVGAVVFSGRSPLEPSFAAIGRTLGVTAIAIILFGAVIGTISGYVAARRLTVRFARMSDAASAWGAGDFSVTVGDRAEDELGQLGRRLNRMAEQLADLIRAREQLSVVDERNRLARDLHDSVKQQAFAVSMNLGSARELWERDPAAARARLDAAYDIARQSQQELTAIIQTLRPIELEHASIDRALSDYVARWQTLTGIAAHAEIAPTTALPRSVEDALFRVTQEALTNIARHSWASRVQVRFGPEQGALRLEITDDGPGFDVRRTPIGMGLQSMRERVEAVGGRFAVVSGASGTKLSVHLPRAADGSE